jgi:hypothetical protein
MVDGRRVDGWMGGWVDEWMGGWVDGWMGGWVDGWMGGWSAADVLLFKHFVICFRES